MEEREHVTDEGTTCWCDPEVLRVEGRVHRAETIATLTARVQGLEADLHNGTNLHTHPGMKALHDDIAELEADRDYYKEALEFVAENGSGSNVPDEWPVWAEEKLHQRRHQN